MAQKFGAHHGRQRQRDERGDQNGDGQGDGKFAEKSAHDIAHEQQRDEHGDQRNRQRQNGEADLLRAFQRGLQRRFAFLDVAGDVFDHDDGIVHHEAGADGERHQRKVIEAVAQQVHHAESAHDGKRHREAGNDGGAHAAQKKKDDHHHQADGQHQLELHVGHRRANGGGAIGKDADLDGRRQRGLQLRQKFFDAVHHGDDVRAGLALNVQDDRRIFVGPRGLANVFRAVDDGGHIGEPHRRAVAVGDDDGAVAVAGNQLVIGADGVSLMLAVERAFGLVDVGLAQRGAQIFQTQPVGRQRRGIRLHAHRGTLAAADADQPNAG